MLEWLTYFKLALTFSPLSNMIFNEKGKQNNLIKFEKAKSRLINEIIRYLPNAVVGKTIIKR